MKDLHSTILAVGAATVVATAIGVLAPATRPRRVTHGDNPAQYRVLR